MAWSLWAAVAEADIRRLAGLGDGHSDTKPLHVLQASTNWTAQDGPVLDLVVRKPRSERSVRLEVRSYTLNR